MAKDALKQLFPDEHTEGEPYWIVAEAQGVFAAEQIFARPMESQTCIMLFATRHEASTVAAHLPDCSGTWAARGLIDRYLRVLVKCLRPEFGFAVVSEVDETTGRFAAYRVMRESLVGD